MTELKEYTRVDKIELQDGDIVEIKDMQNLFDRDILVNNTIPTKYITHTGQEFSYMCVRNDKWIHQLKAGGNGLGKVFVNLQMGICNLKYGNLICNTIPEYHLQMEEVEKYLEEKYGIITSFSQANIKEIELNRTFKISHDFAEYRRIIELMIAEMPKMNIISTFGRTKDSKKYFSEKIEEVGTYSAWSRKSGTGKAKQYRQITFYDKKSCIGSLISIDGDYMRVELKIRGVKNINSAFGTTLFYGLTQEKVNTFFEEQMKKLIVIPMKKWKINRDRYIKKLIKIEYESDIQNWQVNVLRKLADKEIEQNKPCILDVTEVCNLIDEIPYLKRKNRIKTNLQKQANRYEQVFCNGDHLKLQEVIEKLIVKEVTTDNVNLVAQKKSA